MNKKDRNKKVKHLLKSVNADVTILDQDNGNLRHVRVNGFGDIWPNTGTYRVGGAWHKRNFEKLISALERHFNLNQNYEIESQEEEVKDTILNELLKRVEDLEIKVYQLENKG